MESLGPVTQVLELAVKCGGLGVLALLLWLDFKRNTKQDQENADLVRRLLSLVSGRSNGSNGHDGNGSS